MADGETGDASAGALPRRPRHDGAHAAGLQPMLALEERTPVPAFDVLSDFEAIAWDHVRTSHSTRGHPLGPLRPEMLRRGLRPAADVVRLPHGAEARYAGLVTCRQRPATARGVVFLTMEDESGFVNVVLWERVYEEFPVLARTASLLGVDGRIESREGVVHLVARRLWKPDLSQSPPQAVSRDFH